MHQCCLKLRYKRMNANCRKNNNAQNSHAEWNCYIIIPKIVILKPRILCDLDWKPDKLRNLRKKRGYFSLSYKLSKAFKQLFSLPPQRQTLSWLVLIFFRHCVGDGKLCVSRSWICGFSKTEYLDPSYPFHFTTGVRAKGVRRRGGGGYSPVWFDQGVYSICDILNFSAMYLSFADLCRKFSVKSNFLP